MSRKDVLWVGAAASLLLFSGAWLTGYWNNRLVGWLAVIAAVSIACGFAWFKRNARSTISDDITFAAVFSAAAFVVASLIGLVATKWAHGAWTPEAAAPLESTANQVFGMFPGNLMRSILRPSFATLVIGGALMALIGALAAGLLPAASPAAEPARAKTVSTSATRNRTKKKAANKRRGR